MRMRRERTGKTGEEWMALPSETSMVEEAPILRPADETIAEDAQALSVQLKAMREKHEADLEALDQTLAYWRMQIDVARGTYQATLSVGQSVSALAAAIAAENAARAAVNGSHATGLASVPFDGYVAELHRGERVLTAQDNAIFSSGAWARRGDDGAVVAELRELRRRNRLLEQEVEVLRRAAAYLSQAHLPGR